MPEIKSRRLLIAILVVVSLVAFVMTCPVLIFVLKFAWPKIRQHFNTDLQDLQGETEKLNKARN